MKSAFVTIVALSFISVCLPVSAADKAATENTLNTKYELQLAKGQWYQPPADKEGQC